MKDAQKPDHVSLNTLLRWLKEGRFVIPDFQREFEWRPWDINELMRSIFLDYYIGSLLLWKGKKENFDALSCEVIYGFQNSPHHHPWDYGNGKAEYIVLDGQQRLTALYYAFIGPDVPLPNRANRAVYFIHVDKFMNEEYEDAFQYDWLTKRFSRILNDRDAQYEHHVFPLMVVGAGGWELPNWVQGYEAYWSRAKQDADHRGDEEASRKAERFAKNAKEFGEYLRGITEQYQIAYIELDRDLAVDKICDIFTQINSKGIRLDVFDLLNALLKPKGLQLKHMWRDVAPRFEFVDSGKMNVYVLQTMSILKQAYCSPKFLYYLLPGQKKQVRAEDGSLRKEVLIPDTEVFEKLWNQAAQALEDSLGLLRHPQEFGVTSSAYLPYVSILPVFAALQFKCGELPPEERLDGQRKIRHWYWAAVFLNRYSGSVESTSARDFLDVTSWMNGGEEPALIEEFKLNFHNLELRKELKRGSSIYNGIFNLLVINGARDWVTGNIPQQGSLDDHHIVPASKAGNLGIGNAINTILNRTPLTADTNRNFIRDRWPSEYLPELMARNGEDAVRRMLESHFISTAALDILMRQPFTADDFEAFILERQRTIFNAIETLLVKERVDLPPHLRDLDEKIEKIEINLRKLIDDALAGVVDDLPSHVRQKAEGRIQAALRKNVALDDDYYNTLPRVLEYCDLRELQDVIMGKALWQRFVDRFGNKETLGGKFGQLAELRNAIRHSRTVDDVVLKEGEAAILWFNKLLGQPT